MGAARSTFHGSTPLRCSGQAFSMVERVYSRMIFFNSFSVSPKTGVNFLLVKDSLADVMVLRQQTPQWRSWANGGTGLHFNRLFPQIHALVCLVFNSDTIFNPQCRACDPVFLGKPRSSRMCPCRTIRRAGRPSLPPP